MNKWSETEDWQKEGGRFVPYPAKWLNAAGWLDEAPEPEPAKIVSSIWDDGWGDEK